MNYSTYAYRNICLFINFLNLSAKNANKNECIRVFIINSNTFIFIYMHIYVYKSFIIIKYVAFLFKEETFRIFKKFFRYVIFSENVLF